MQYWESQAVLFLATASEIKSMICWTVGNCVGLNASHKVFFVHLLSYYRNMHMLTPFQLLRSWLKFEILFNKGRHIHKAANRKK